MRLGYAQHVCTAQGRTVERIHVVAGGWQTGREASYVGVSRARDASYVFADRSSLGVDGRDRHGGLEELSRRMATSRENIAAVTRSGELGRTKALASSERRQGGDGRPSVEQQPHGAAEYHTPRDPQTETDAEHETWRALEMGARAAARSRASASRPRHREIEVTWHPTVYGWGLAAIALARRYSRCSAAPGRPRYRRRCAAGGQTSIRPKGHTERRDERARRLPEREGSHVRARD